MFPTTHAFLREPKGVFSLNFGVSTKFTRFSGSFECFWATWSVLTNQIRVDFLENMSVLTNQIRAKTWQYGVEFSLNIGVHRNPKPRVFRTSCRGIALNVSVHRSTKSASFSQTFPFPANQNLVSPTLKLAERTITPIYRRSKSARNIFT